MAAPGGGAPGGGGPPPGGGAPGGGAGGAPGGGALGGGALAMMAMAPADFVAAVRAIVPGQAPADFVAAVRAIMPEQAAQPRGSRVAPLLEVRNQVLFPGGNRDDRGSTTLPGQLLTATTAVFIESFRGFHQVVTNALRAHTQLTPAEQAILLAVHDPWPGDDALPVTPLTASEDAHLLCFLRRATIDIDKGVISMATSGYPSETAAVLVTQGRRLLARIIALGTKFCAAQNLPAQKWRDTALAGQELFSRTTTDFSAIYAWASMATMAAAAYLEAAGQTAAVKTDVWMLTKGLHVGMGVTVSDYTTTSPHNMLVRVAAYAEAMIQVSYSLGTGFAMQAQAQPYAQPDAFGLAAIEETALPEVLVLAAEVRHLQEQVRQQGLQQPAQQQPNWQSHGSPHPGQGPGWSPQPPPWQPPWQQPPPPWQQPQPQPQPPWQ